MQKYISQSVYADNLKECIYGFLEDSRNITRSSTVFWSFLETIEFSFGKISRDCYFFRQMKEYADEHPITKTSLIWQIHFENADENLRRRNTQRLRHRIIDGIHRRVMIAKNDDNCTLEIWTRRKFFCRPGTFGKKSAIQITRVAPEGDEGTDE